MTTNSRITKEPTPFYVYEYEMLPEPVRIRGKRKTARLVTRHWFATAEEAQEANARMNGAGEFDRVPNTLFVSGPVCADKPSYEYF